MIVNFSSDAIEGTSKWHNIFQILKEKKITHEFYVLEEYPFEMEGRVTWVAQVIGHLHLIQVMIPTSGSWLA